jgi:hypothetical protein
MYDTQLFPPLLILVDFDGVELTGLHTDTALDAEGLIDDMNLFSFARDCSDGALACAGRTTDTLLGIDRVGNEFLTGAAGTSLVHDVGEILFLEVLHRREDRVGSGLSQSTQTALLHGFTDGSECVQILECAIA